MPGQKEVKDVAGRTSQKERLTEEVSYILSPDLLQCSDALPSNKGRSSLVHSLAYHLGLLDLGEVCNNSSSRNSNVSHDGADTSPTSVLIRLLRGSVDDMDEASSTAAKSLDSIRRARVVQPELATSQQLKTYHAEAYVEALLDDAANKASDEARSSKRRKLDRNQQILEDSQWGFVDGTPRFAVLRAYALHLAGAALQAAEELRSGRSRYVILWDGGRHHARRAQAAGYCYVADAVLAILAMRKAKPRIHPPRYDRVLYLDLDLHWGDGVEEAFYNTAGCLTLSVHHWAPGFFPCGSSEREASGSSAGSLRAATGPLTAPAHALNLPLQVGASDATLARIWKSCIEPVVKAYKPQAVVVQLGVDAMAGDPHAIHNVSSVGFLQCVAQIKAWSLPTLFLGGGGYHSSNAASAWGSVTAQLLGRWSEWPDEGFDTLNSTTPIPLHSHWPAYSRLNLQVPESEALDQNDDAYLTEVEAVFKQRVELLNSCEKRLEK